MTELALFILSFSHHDWEGLLGSGSDVDSFLEYVWDKAKTYEEGEPSSWVKHRIQEYLG